MMEGEAKDVSEDLSSEIEFFANHVLSRGGAGRSGCERGGCLLLVGGQVYQLSGIGCNLQAWDVGAARIYLYRAGRLPQLHACPPPIFTVNHSPIRP
jgi:hypothetical protein